MPLILVTGGAGFIGSHLVPVLLSAGYQVRVLDTLSRQIHGDLPVGIGWLHDTPGLQFIRGSVTSREDLVRAINGIEAVVHLASETGTGQSMYEISRYAHENVQGTAELCQVLASTVGHTVRNVVLASSRSVYGEGAYQRPSDGARITPSTRTATALKSRKWEPICPHTGETLELVPTREDDRTAPSSIYAATKLMQEDLVRITCDSTGIGHAILRLQNVYGEGQSLKNPYTGILSIFSTRIRRGLQLPIFEDGLESRDFVHVSDVAAAFLKAIERPKSINAVVNVGCGVATSVIDVARGLSEAFGVTPDTQVTGEYRLGDIRHNFADTRRLRDLLGHIPRIDLATGLARFAAWVATQPLPEDQLDKANAELVAKGMMG